MTQNPAPPTAKPQRPKKGAVLDLEIEKFADRGKSLARPGGYVVFVAGAVPGDTVRGAALQAATGLR